MNHQRKVFAIFVALVSGLLFAAFAAAQTSSTDMDNLLGSWNAEVVVKIQAATFPALLTFSPGGGLIADEPPGPGETSGHGNWVSTGESEIRFTFVSLFSGEGGAYAGKLKVVGTLKFDASSQTWSGPFKIDGVDAKDVATFSDTGTFDLTRIEIRSLE